MIPTYLCLVLLALPAALAQGECGVNVVQMVTRTSRTCSLRFNTAMVNRNNANVQSAVAAGRAEGDRKYQQALTYEEAIVRAGVGVKRRTPAYHHYLTNSPAAGSQATYRRALQYKHRAIEIGKAVTRQVGLPASLSGDMLLHLRISIPETCVPTPRCNTSSRYRNYDGSCTNLDNPKWGLAGEPYTRYLLPVYNDGIYEFRRARDGSELPSARLLRTLFIPDRNYPSYVNTLVVMQWGQLVAHDVAQSPDQIGADGVGLMCCTLDGKQLSPNLVSQGCHPMSIPTNDEYYSQYGQRCMSVSRSNATYALNCMLSAAEQHSLPNMVMDGSIVHGFSKEMADGLRTFQRGKLRTQTSNGRQFLPQEANPTDTCDRPSMSDICYSAGDFRVNQNTQLSVMQVVLMREHNRIAEQLATINPRWNDETVYQETRRIIGALFQHITYNEMVRHYLGFKTVDKYDLLPLLRGEGYNTGYNPRITINTLNSFTTGAYRAFHGLVQGPLKMVDYNRCPVKDILISSWMDNPTVVQQNNNYDELLLGLVDQPSQMADIYSTAELNNRMFRTDQPYGQDLNAFDIVRARDHGLPSYNEFRVLCGIPRAYSWDDFLDTINYANVDKLASVYGHPDDVDLFVGGFVETLVPDAMLGPTFHCLATDQFYRYKFADRFFYEFRNNGLGFTPVQLDEIRKSSMARLVCDNGDKITTMQQWAFLRVSNSNPLMSCNNTAKIPRIDLTKWKV